MSNLSICFIKYGTDEQIMREISNEYDLVISTWPAWANDGNTAYYICGEIDKLISAGLHNCMDPGFQDINGKTIHCAYITLRSFLCEKVDDLDPDCTEELIVHSDVAKAILFNM